MAYKKPKIVAKSAPKQTYVAGCPTHPSGGCWGNPVCKVSPSR